MPPSPWKSQEDAEGVPAEICGDRIGALPDTLLHHILSLLPAEEAVRTSVLARRWRYLWKFTPGVRLGCLGTDELVSVNALRKFVDPLLRLRGDLPLQTFELRFDEFKDEGNERCVNLWFRHAVACKVQVLKLLVSKEHLVSYKDPWFKLEDIHLVSRHLTTLQLYSVRCFTAFLDFSGCPALDCLEFGHCIFELATKIMSQSLKSLTITDSSLSEEFRVQICAPNLIALCLDELWDKTPVLDSMPSLIDAFVQITDDSPDICLKLRGAHYTCDCQYCDSSNNIAYGGSVLLKGLSEARNLALIGTLDTFIFKWDLRWCPTFSKLKTLVLNENWCVPDDLCALACILEHAPNLEKLSLQLFRERPPHKVEIIGSFSSMDRSTAISEQLKIVEIKCQVVDDRVLKVLHFFCTFGISFRF